MGQEITCRIRRGKKLSEGKAQLESEHLILRAGNSLKIPFQSINSVKAQDGWLLITLTDALIELELGGTAEKWVRKILNPPSRLDKLGLKSGARVSIQSVKDKQFAEEIMQCGAHLCLEVEANSDLIFFQADSRDELCSLNYLKNFIQQNGAIWIIYPKGIQDITQAEVIAAIKNAGLTDVKVASFSPSHTSLKAVIPGSKRGLK